MKKILLAGSTGYLGIYIAKELQQRSYFFRAIARSPEKLAKNDIEANEILKAELTDPDSIKKCCEGVDIVISTVGITRQKDGLTYMDVDYQANMNLLIEAQKSGAKKFIYISVLNGEKLRNLKICDAKELFVEQLKRSGIDYCIVRPNGFFSDMSEIFNMAKNGRIYLFGKGKLKANPIHGEDLATFCVDAIEKPDKEVEIGGPETLTQNEMASMAFKVLGDKPKITYIPDWIRVAALKLVKLVTISRFYGPVEFFMTVMAMDMLAPEYGNHTLKEYFTILNNADAKKLRL
ncbi:SDR family oxidoreductase [Desulfobacter curvatus]|uniref:SDR family oxidoreductase n=1 Tax=Desulfobacter curvatus TaxID=2290 RepID=UPI000371F631|nr:SDR family oxidoreductase [Desulfobacter curvatus]